MPLELAVALAKHRGGLSFDGLHEISVAAAKELAKAKDGMLSLGGLPKISAETAIALSKFEGVLFLNGAKAVSDEAAAAFGKSKLAGLYLEGLDSISESAVASLAKASTGLSIQLHSLSASSAAALCQNERSVLQIWTQKASEDSFEHLAKYRGDELEIIGLRCITERAATELAKFRGKVLRLTRIQTPLSEEAARALRKCKKDVSWSVVDS